MKIATWNVNGIRASFSKGLEDFVERESPDILCLQETKAHPDQLEDKIRSLGNYPFVHWSPSGVKKGYSGTVTFSRDPVLNWKTGISIKKFDWEGRMVISEHKDFCLLNIYFPNGALTITRHLFKQDFLNRLPIFLKELQKTCKKELIIVGDYNVAYLDIDVHSPKTLQKTSGFLPEERQWFKDFLEQGYIDVFRHFYPDKKDAYSWWSFRENARNNNKGWRIDYICVSKPLESRLKSIEIKPEQLGSDHCPIILELSN